VLLLWWRCSYAPPQKVAMLTRWRSSDGSRHASTTGGIVLNSMHMGDYSYERVEALIHPRVDDDDPTDRVYLMNWYSATRDSFAMTNSSETPPDPAGGYQLWATEVWAQRAMRSLYSSRCAVVLVSR
jgi:hypothetical protein